VSRALLTLIAIFLLGLVVWASLSHLKTKTGVALAFRPVAHELLPGWQGDDLLLGFGAFQKSCAALLKLPENRRLPGAAIGGRVKDWTGVCEQASSLQKDEAEIRAFFEQAFTPLEVTLNGEHKGLFTGYFEALLKGSFEASEQYRYPLYALPKDLVSVDLGAFRPEFKGDRIAGKVRDNRLIPYEDRAAIENGAINDRSDILMWVDSPVDAFFLHIQGSGRVQLADGSFQGVGYAGQNGHVYRAIGRDLIEMGEVKREDMSMQAIRRWLGDNADSAADLMNRNRSYIFFRLLENGDGPFGSAGVALTAERSLAVDLRHLPLHAPMWLSASRPPLDRENVAEDGDQIDFNRLMVAQDTGGAIRGEIRGDVFWGFGERASEIAGRMANQGQYWLLLPNALAERVLAAQS